MPNVWPILTLIKMIRLHQILADGRAQLLAAGIKSGVLDADLLLADVLGLDRAGLVLGRDRILDEEERARYQRLLTRRAAHEPVAYLLGTREFWGLSFKVSPRTLIPRPDSETLVEAVLARVRERPGPLRLLDLGTGSGCLLVSLLHALPNAEGIGIDLSPDALAVARHNAGLLDNPQRAVFLAGDWYAGLPVDCPPFDVILSNPPYIPDGDVAGLMRDVRDYEPHIALCGGDDGLQSYRILTAHLVPHLRPGGIAAFEVGQGQAQAVIHLMHQALDGMIVEQEKDLSGIVRVIIGQIPHD